MSTHVYPRLSEVDALARLAVIRDAAAESFQTITGLVAVEHEQAAPVPTGGPVAGPSMVWRVRDAIREDLGDMLAPDGRITVGLPAYDWCLGRSLYQHLQIVHSDAAHASTWNFLSLMVFPDLVWARFPEPSEDRALGGPRNVLRRAWRRYELLGELDGRGAEHLNEDELVQLTERTSLARNRLLVAKLARCVIAYQGSGRMQFTRELCKRATFMTGPLLVDCLKPAELTQLVDAVSNGQPWNPATY
jgi:hypothetical protein